MSSKDLSRGTRSTRRAMICALALTAALTAAAPGVAQLDLDKPEDALQAMRKIQCSTVDAKPGFYWWEGKALSRVPGERDRTLFGFYGMNVRACATVEDPEKGTGYRMVSREILLYTDPRSGEVLRTWENPWTGDEVEVIHIANDPVNSRAPSFPMGPRGPYQLGATIQDGRGWLTFEVPLFYENPLGGDYQKYIGGTYQAIEMFNFFFDADRLVDESTTDLVNTHVGWARVSQWLPWMEMGSRVGQMMFHGAGKRVATFDDLPEVLKKEIRASYPKYDEPPPVDDTRENETSWTYFKKVLSEKSGN